jgi:hypothetical protein
MSTKQLMAQLVRQGSSRPTLEGLMTQYGVHDWNSWIGNYIVKTVEPLARCGAQILKSMGSSKHDLVRYIDSITTLATEIVNRAKGGTGVIGGCGFDEFIKYSVESTMYYSPYTFFAVSIRRITPIHFYLHYGDPGKYSEVLNELGFEWRLEPELSSTNANKLNVYEIGGYRDWNPRAVGYEIYWYYSSYREKFKVELPYVTSSGPYVAPSSELDKGNLKGLSLGVLITLLNETVWDMVLQRRDLSSLIMYGDEPLINTFINYAKMVNDSLRTIANTYKKSHYICNRMSSICSKLFDVESFDINKAITMFNYVRNYYDDFADFAYIIFKDRKEVMQSTLIAPRTSFFDDNFVVFNGLLVLINWYEREDRDNYVLWNSFMDMIMPQLMLNRLELIELNPEEFTNKIKNAYPNYDRIQKMETPYKVFKVLRRWWYW